MCRTLRVLNALRTPDIGLPLTYAQLSQIGIGLVIERLITRGAYGAAADVADFLAVPRDQGSLRVLRAWASQKVRESEFDEEETAARIRLKLGPNSGISFSEIAAEAVRRGRRQLAIRLLELETRASEQVPLLLMLDQPRLALEQAIASGDTHLLFTVLHRLKNSCHESEFLTLVRSYPIPFSLYERVCRDDDAEQLRSMFKEDEDFVSDGASWIKQSLRQDSKERLMKSLQSAVASFKKAKNDFAVATTEDQIKLLKLQFRLKDKNHIDCTSCSITGTLRAILLAREYKVADEFRREFKVSDKRFWWTKIIAESSQGNWSELEKFSKSKKSPIGFEVRPL